MFNAAELIQFGGLLLILLVVYGQTGLFFCFFLPSGGLLFMAGVLIANDLFDHSLFIVNSLGVAASVLGNITGYLIGNKAGPLLYRRTDSRFFRKQYLTAAENFYKKYGGLALSIGVFLPLIRTFGPIVAGVIKLKFNRFLMFVLMGSIGWVLSFTFAGYLIGSMPILRPYLRYVVLAIVITVTVPVVVKIVREFRKKDKTVY